MPPEPEPSPAPNPNRHLGPPLRRTDDDRARAAEVSIEDILDARDAWKKHAPDGFRGLLDAKAERRGDS